jgi:phosphoglycerate dehydrogenase-like enzyme
MGHDVIPMPDERGDLPCSPDGIEGVIGNGLFLYHPIEDFTSLRYVQLTSAGFDRMPMDYAESHGITVRNARGVYSVPMAEYALWGVLTLYKEGRFFAANQTACRWDKHRGLRELYGKRVAVVGCGSIGTECARRFAAMGCRVMGVDLYPREDAAYEAMYPVDALGEGLPKTDILVLTLPLTDETRHLIGKDELAALPDGAVVVNISRGGVVDTEALTNALSERALYAVLDVFEREPLPAEHPLWSLPNAIVTPHNSFVGEGNGKRLAEVITENLERFV